MDDDVVVLKVIPVSSQSGKSNEFNHLLLTTPIKQEPRSLSPSHTNVIQVSSSSSTNAFPPSGSGPPVVMINQSAVNQPQFRGAPTTQMQIMQPPNYPSVSRPRQHILPNNTIQTGPNFHQRPVVHITSTGSQPSSVQTFALNSNSQGFHNSNTPGGPAMQQIFIPSGASNPRASLIHLASSAAGSSVRVPNPVINSNSVRGQTASLINQNNPSTISSVRTQRPILPHSNGVSNAQPAPSAISPNSVLPTVTAGVAQSVANPGRQISTAANGTTSNTGSSTLPGNMQWGRVNKDTLGNTIFYGLTGLVLSSCEAISAQINESGSTMDVQKLSLKESSPIFDVSEILKGTPAEISGRKGYHKCMGCRSLFLSTETYMEHMNRLQLRIEYDCPVCQKQLTVHNRCALMLHIKGHANSPQLDPNHLKVSNLPLDQVKVSYQQKNKANIKELNKLIQGNLPEWDFDLFTPFTRLPSGRRFYLMERAKEPVAANHPCAMCDFTPPSVSNGVSGENSELMHHLLGSSANSTTKCALCTLVVPINRESVCAFKAHILLHMDIYVMCPRCGFTAPTDLSPPECEEVMRLHLRYVCYHFNVVQIYLCSRCTSGKAFNSLLQYTTHIFEEHSTKMYRCNVCFGKGPIDNEVYEYATLAEVIQHLQKKHTQEIQANKPRLYSTPSRCPDCPKSFTKQEFIDHYVKFHNRASNKGRTAYRCFGECKQIHREFGDLRDHMTQCSQVKQIMDTAPINQYFCLYCGIGARRRTIGPGQFVASYKCTYLENLYAVHQHEGSHLHLESTNGGHTACPWCKEKMPQILERLLEHMRGHLKENKTIAEAIRRQEEYYSVNGVELPCHCRFSLDSPSSLESHALNEESAHIPLPRDILEFFLSTPPPSFGKPIDCKFCSEKKESLWTLVEHTFHAHKNKVCYICREFSMTESPSSHPHKSKRQFWKHVWKCMKARMSSDLTVPPRFSQNDDTSIILNGFNAEDRDEYDSSSYSGSKENRQNGYQDDQSINPNGSEYSEDNANPKTYMEQQGPKVEVALLECSKCGSSAGRFFTDEELSQHWLTEHGSRLSHACVLCGFKLESMKALMEHQFEAHNRSLRSFGVSLGNEAQVALDSQSHTYYRCYICSKKLDKRVSALKHMIHTHKISKADINWGLLSENSASLKRPKVEQIDDDGQSVDSTALDDQKENKVSGDRPPVKRLRIEPPAKQSSDKLTANGATAEPEDNNFECALCDFRDEDREAFINHLNDLHCPHDQKNAIYMCCDCGLSFISEKALHIHLKALHKIKDISGYFGKWRSYIVHDKKDDDTPEQADCPTTTNSTEKETGNQLNPIAVNQ